MTDVVMPQMGESIVEGTLTKWLKKPGEQVERDEPLFEISTDKVDTEIPSPAAGTLSEVLVEEGQDGRHQYRRGANRGRRRRSGATRSCQARRSRRRHRRCRRPAAPPPAAGRRRSRPPQETVRPTVDDVTTVESQPRPAPRHSNRRRTARRAGRSAFTAGAADGARIQYRPGPGERHRRRRTHHQAGRRGLHGAARHGARPAAPPSAAPQPPPPARAAARHAPPAPPQPAASASRRCRGRAGQNPRRADEHHAHQDRRAHGDEQAHVGARHHRPQGGYDARWRRCATATRPISRRAMACR